MKFLFDDWSLNLFVKLFPQYLYTQWSNNSKQYILPKEQYLLKGDQIHGFIHQTKYQYEWINLFCVGFYWSTIPLLCIGIKVSKSL